MAHPGLWIGFSRTIKDDTMIITIAIESCCSWPLNKLTARSLSNPLGIPLLSKISAGPHYHPSIFFGSTETNPCKESVTSKIPSKLPSMTLRYLNYSLNHANPRIIRSAGNTLLTTSATKSGLVFTTLRIPITPPTHLSSMESDATVPSELSN